MTSNLLEKSLHIAGKFILLSQCFCFINFISRTNFLQTNNFRTEGHQRLKRYLHPYCRPCDKEFPARMDWVEHRLTPEHLLRMAEILADKTGGPGKLK